MQSSASFYEIQAHFFPPVFYFCASVHSVAVDSDLKRAQVKSLGKPGTGRATSVATWERIVNHSLGGCGSRISTVNHAN